MALERGLIQIQPTISPCLLPCTSNRTCYPNRRPLRLRASSSASAEAPSPAKATQYMKQLGSSDVKITQIGVGAWAWGDTFFWNDGSWDARKMEDARAAFNASVDAGITFFDTAEVYGSKVMGGGEDSESLLGRPGIWGNEAYIDGLADAVQQGLVKAVGVSNYNEKRLRDAHSQLKKRGIPLASNQVNYSLIYRAPEKNGVKRTCEELGITLIAYSPIGQGVLSGKYTPENPPSGPRGQIYNRQFLRKAGPLLRALKDIGERYEKTPTQVSLNWLLAQGDVVPIPGAKNATQAKEFSGAFGWSLTNEDVQELRELASKLEPVVGFPAENI